MSFCFDEPETLTRADVRVERGAGGWIWTKYDALVGSVGREEHPSWPDRPPMWCAHSRCGTWRAYADTKAAAVQLVLDFWNMEQAVEV